MKRPKAAIIGSGNLATHLLPALKKSAEIALICLYSRNETSGMHLCKRNKIAYAKSFTSIPDDVKIVFIMSSDSSIRSVSNELANTLAKDTIIVHFSGSQNLESVNAYFSSRASVWPIQSISSIDTSLDLNSIPFCIYASDSNTGSFLASIFKNISDQVIELSQEQKAVLHLAAVFANNFSNHMMALSKQILEGKGLNFELLKPIILKTAQNATKLDPIKIQTGPAARNDIEVLQKHQELLKDEKNLLKLYQLISDSIKNG